jgi:hypothetical protein
MHDAAVVPAQIQLGYYYSTTYDPFQAGDDCPIFYGLQGGSWTMPAVRIRGLISPGRFNASLITEAGEMLGAINQRQTFNTQTDGWAEIKRLPIPAHHAPPNDDAPIDDLFNQRATLSMSITDEEGHSASASADVVLVDNPIL